MSLNWENLVLNRPHLFSDVVELLVLFDEEFKLNSQVSKSDIISFLQREKYVFEEEQAEFEEGNIQSGPISYDKASAAIDDCFFHLSYREKTLKNLYPFTIKGDVLILKKRVKPIYKFLLVCSRQRTFTDQITNLNQKCGSAFEEVCKKVNEQIFKGTFRTINFGPTYRAAAGLSNNLKTALKEISKFLKFEPNEEYIDNNYRPQGDAGIDVISFFPLPDKAYGTIAILGQCAAMEKEGNWSKKVHEGDYIALRDISKGKWPTFIHTFYIPVLYRNSSGAWVNELYFRDSVIFDRERICKIYGKKHLPAGAREILNRISNVF